MLIPDALTFILNAAWQVTLIAILAAISGRLIRRSPARMRHLLYVCAIVASAAVPFSAILKPAAAAAIPAFHAMPRTFVVPPWIGSVIIIAAGLAITFRLARLLVAVWRTRSPSSSDVDESSMRIASRCATALGVPKYRLTHSDSALGPFSIGRLIVVPHSLAQSGSDDLLTTAIGHELAHVRRHDFAVNLALEVLIVPLAFHPAIWFLKRRADDLCELACDELVIGAGLQNRVSYARSLLHFAETAVAPHRSHAMAIAAPPLLEERIRVLAGDPSRMRRGRALASLAALTCAAVVSAGFAVRASVEVDWLSEGLSACEAGDANVATDAVSHLDEAGRADLMIGCAASHIGWCDDKGFSREDDE